MRISTSAPSKTQRHKILARLAHLGHPAKVIRFPKAPQGELPIGRVNRRWISVAAAAGLLIGLLGGQLVHLVPQQTRRLAPMATSIAPSAPASGPTFVPVSATGGRWLSRRDRAGHAGPKRLRAPRPRRIYPARQPLTGGSSLNPALFSTCATNLPYIKARFRKHQLWAGRNTIKNMKTLRKLFICLVLSLIVQAAAQPAYAQSFKWWQTERFQKELKLDARADHPHRRHFPGERAVAPRAERGRRPSRGETLESHLRSEVR